MKLDVLVNMLNGLDGNYQKGDDVYISLENIKKMSTLLFAEEELPDILITPFLLDITTGNVYELHYYEFEIEIKKISASCFLEYSTSNTLPSEITENIKAKAIVSFGDSIFYINAITDYLSAMQKMTFEKELLRNPQLKSYQLCYQLY